MGLLINQGVHTESDFKPLVGTNILAEIVQIELAKNRDGAITIKFQVLSGANKGKFFWDTVEYRADSPFAWKYKALRRAAGQPYKKDEPAKIDIEALLLNKAVTVDLSIREGKDGREYQGVTYKAPKSTSKIPSTEPEEEKEPDNTDDNLLLVDDDDDDLPF